MSRGKRLLCAGVLSIQGQEVVIDISTHHQLWGGYLQHGLTLLRGLALDDRMTSHRFPLHSVSGKPVVVRSAFDVRVKGLLKTRSVSASVLYTFSRNGRGPLKRIVILSIDLLGPIDRKARDHIRQRLLDAAFTFMPRLGYVCIGSSKRVRTYESA